MDFSTWIAAGLMIVIGAVWVIMLQRRPAPRRGHGDRSGRIRALAPVLRIAMAYPLDQPLPHRHDARDVHARRLHARHRHGLVRLVRRTPSTTSTRSEAASTSAPGTGAAAPIDGHASRDRKVAGADARATSPPSAASPCWRSTRRRSAPAGRSRRTWRGGSTGSFLEHTTFDLGAIARGYGSEPRGVGRARHHARGSRSSTASSCPAATTSTSRWPRPTSGSPASTSTTERSTRFR